MQDAGSGTSELALADRNGAEKSNAPLVSGQFVTGTPGVRYCAGSSPCSLVSETKCPVITPPTPPEVYCTNETSLSVFVPGSRNATCIGAGSGPAVIHDPWKLYTIGFPAASPSGKSAFAGLLRPD